MLVDLAALALRIAVGGIFFYEGYHKVAHDPDVPRGRNGLAALIARQGFPKPQLMAGLVCVSELVGGAFVALGLITRLAVLPLMITVGLATFLFKWKAGYAGGWDWPFSVFAASVVVLLLGSGAYSLDALIGIPFMGTT